MNDARPRRLVVLSGDTGWCRRQALALVPLEAGSVLWIGRDEVPGVCAMAPERAADLLGRETDCVVFDAHTGFDVDAFAAVSGTIRGGGALVLLTPPLARWPDLPDAACACFLSSPLGPDDAGPHFLRRFVRLLHADADVCLLGPGDALPALPVVSRPRADGGVEPTADQRRAIAAVRRVVSGHRRRPAVLVADRGRGKSAALGMAAAALLREGHGPILVTAPRRAAVQALFEHARRLLPEGRLASGRLVRGAGELRFVAPDELLRGRPQAALLVVDEAAAIPAALLAAMLRHYARIAFATTVHGYEGTGRGFAVRFERTLDRETPGWQRLVLHEPVRWAAGDPLERFVFHALLLDAEPLPAGTLGDRVPDRCRIGRLDPARLAGDDRLLSQLFGLLVQAHYRTRPRDLRFLLDAPDARVHAARNGAAVVAAAVTVEEGGLSAALSAQILNGRRRARGHLLPQSLVAHLGVAEAIGQRFRRVVRIAVHPAVQRHGLGRRLIGALLAEAEAEGCDWLGASFGATPALLQFWRAAGFVPVRVGLHREASTGEHAVLMLRALSDRARRLQAELQRRFAANMAHLLADALQGLSPALVSLLLAGGVGPKHAADAEARRLIEACARGNRGIEDSLALLFGVVWNALLDGTAEQVIDDPGVQALIRRVVQKRSWPEIVEEFGCRGRAEAERLVRAGVAELLS